MPDHTAPAKDPKICSKEGCLRPRYDTKGTNGWCSECRAAYQADYTRKAAWRNERKGIIRGILETRRQLAAYFKGWSDRPMTGAEVSYMIEQHPGPKVED